MWWLRAGTTVSNDKQQQKETGISRDATSFPSSSSGAIDDDVVIQAAESRDNEPLPTLSPNDESSSSSVSSTTAAGTDNRQSLLSPTMYNSFRNSTLEATIGIADEILDDDAERLWKTSQIMTSKRRQFLDRIAVISSSLMRREQDAVLAHSDPDVDLEAITPQSDLTLPNRHIHIVTTAALPWFTGTSVNPLLRAAYMHRKTQKINRRSSENSRGGGGNNQRWVTLVIPWLELPEDQEILYGRVFVDCQEQEDFIRAWLRDDAGMADAADAETGLEICFYPARYHTGLGSIFAMGDIMDTVILLNNETSAAAQERQLDVCVLEEPEHCNWYRAPGDGWTKRFNYVVGVVHTSK